MKNNLNIYLTASYFRKPVDLKRTSEVGYMKTDGNFELEENVNFTRKITKKEMRDCNVIIDVINQTIIKCSLGELKGQSYDQVFSYFYKNYTEYFDRLYKTLGIDTNEAKVEVTEPGVIDITADEVMV
jgi:hypothetical protein